MTSTEITYDEGGYALAPQGQACKLRVCGSEPVTQAEAERTAQGARPEAEREAEA